MQAQSAKTLIPALSREEKVVLTLESERVLLVFSVGKQLAALPLENVQRIAPMAQLARPPGLPSPLEGILNLRGTAVPVLRLDRLLRLPVQETGLYSMLIVLKGHVDGAFALLVERTSEVRSVPLGDFLPVDRADSFNACAEASFVLRGETVTLLSPRRLLLEKETQALAEFRTLARRRIEEWGAADQ
jgi:purine-binding chemotaxis protein CheW